MADKYDVLPITYQSKAFDICMTKCLFCDRTFDVQFKLFPNRVKIDKLRKHLLLEHLFVISDINDIADLGGYLQFWREKFGENPQLSQYCAVIRTNTGKNDVEESKDYFMLCPDVLPEDKAIRNDLIKAKLSKLLNFLEHERNDKVFRRTCLFCRKEFTCGKKGYFEHLKESHNFNFGNADHIVFAHEFLDLIEEKLNRRICLYCEYAFKDWNALKEHMRKKLHKHLNPFNKDYDRFYLSNYLRANKKWKKGMKKISRNETENSPNYSEAEDGEDGEDTWDDWIQEEEDQLCIKCLFCDAPGEKNFEGFKSHALEVHAIDFFGEIEIYSFYQKVKLINFLRSKLLKLECIHCDQNFSNEKDLLTHYEQTEHLKLPHKDKFDHPEFYLPKIPNDHLLQLLVEKEDENEETPEVIPE